MGTHYNVSELQGVWQREGGIVSLQMANSSAAANMTSSGGSSSGPDTFTIIFCTFYGLICLTGLLGNGLVIYVVTRYTKMMSVTNMYILNLAVSDMLFLIGLPFLMTTVFLRNWIFGRIICKLFYICTSINWFTSVFQLTVMAADRYVAVCHPITAVRIRTTMIARVVCFAVWLLSLLVMLPVVLYTTTIELAPGHVSCTIAWPQGQLIPADKAFIWYALLLAFAFPVALISVFYALVVMRLKNVGPKNRAPSKGKKQKRKKVTIMVLSVITVYIICWLPYWCFQIALTFASENTPRWSVYLFQVITVMSYANSMLNPFLYAFLSDNFRKSFIQAFKCAGFRKNMMVHLAPDDEEDDEESCVLNHTGSPPHDACAQHAAMHDGLNKAEQHELKQMTSQAENQH